MKNLDDEHIEEAFAKIRLSFEKRNNEFGLEILDSYEGQWNATGKLSDRQITWLERQLDGSWRRTERQTNGIDPCFENQSQEEDFSQNSEQGVEQLFDAMVRQKLAEEGKALVDLAPLKELAQALDGVRELLKSLR